MAVAIKPNRAVKRNKAEGLKVLLFGKPNIGKTTMATSFPNSVILNTDGNLGAFDRPSYQIKAWKVNATTVKQGISEDECFVNVIDALLSTSHEFDTIIVEIGSHIYNYMRSYILGVNNIKHESEAEWGKGWSFVKTEWETVMLRLFNCKYNVLFITHEDIRDIEGRNKKYTVPTPDLPAAQVKFIGGLTQITARMTVNEIVRDGKRLSVRGLQVLPENESEVVGNKIGLSIPFIELEEGYEYEDLVALINTGDAATKIKTK